MTQPLSLKDQLRSLESLQELDLKIDSLKKKKGAHPATLKGLSETVVKAKATADAKRNAIAELEKNQRQTVAAMELNADRVTRANGKLEAVHNSQEFQAANKEIDQLKKAAATLDEQLKKINGDIDGAKRELVEFGALVEKAQSEHDGQASLFTDEGQRIDGEISALTTERGKYTGSVDPRILAQYDRVRGARAGLGIVPAVAGRCKGCNMVVPPQMYNEVQRCTAIQQCPSCHRILFMPQASASAAQG